MFDKDALIQELGIENLTQEEQARVLDEYQVQVGEALAKNLSQEKLDEFEAIINGEQMVIDNWLASNEPNYKDEVAYQQLLEGYDEDPDKVPADKVFASMAWVEKNSPNLQETIESIKEVIKANIDEYKS